MFYVGQLVNYKKYTGVIHMLPTKYHPYHYTVSIYNYRGFPVLYKQIHEKELTLSEQIPLDMYEQISISGL